jgi:hypothetical protein
MPELPVNILIVQSVFILTNVKHPIPKPSTHQISTSSDASASLISSSRIKILKSPSITTHHMPRTHTTSIPRQTRFSTRSSLPPLSIPFGSCRIPDAYPPPIPTFSPKQTISRYKFSNRILSPWSYLILRSDSLTRGVELSTNLYKNHRRHKPMPTADLCGVARVLITGSPRII